VSTPHKRRHRARKATGRNAASGTTAPRARGGKQPPKNRWFYDVRQYALLTDASGNLLILQLPKEYDSAAANTWTLPGGKLEPTDEPGEGLLREITEETGLKATLTGPCAVARWTSRNSKKLGIFYAATVSGTKPTLKLSGEHQRAIWLEPAEAKDFPFHRPEMLTVIQTHTAK
jgi:8-oxo-dGTP pyrophosphatase MutT (NUDIX family)